MNIDRFKPLTVYTIYIAASPEKVWQALTSAEFSRRYFFGNSVKAKLYARDPRPASRSWSRWRRPSACLRH